MRRVLLLFVFVVGLLLSSCSNFTTKPEDEIIGKYTKELYLSTYISETVYKFWKTDDDRYIGYESIVNGGVEASHRVFSYSIEGNEITFDYGFGFVTKQKYEIDNGNLVFLDDNGERYGNDSGVYRKIG